MQNIYLPWVIKALQSAFQMIRVSYLLNSHTGENQIQVSNRNCRMVLGKAAISCDTLSGSWSVLSDSGSSGIAVKSHLAESRGQRMRRTAAADWGARCAASGTLWCLPASPQPPPGLREACIEPRWPWLHMFTNSLFANGALLFFRFFEENFVIFLRHHKPKQYPQMRFFL